MLLHLEPHKKTWLYEYINKCFDSAITNEWIGDITPAVELLAKQSKNKSIYEYLIKSFVLESFLDRARSPDKYKKINIKKLRKDLIKQFGDIPSAHSAAETIYNARYGKGRRERMMKRDVINLIEYIRRDKSVSVTAIAKELSKIKGVSDSFASIKRAFERADPYTEQRVFFLWPPSYQ